MGLMLQGGIGHLTRVFGLASAACPACECLWHVSFSHVETGYVSQKVHMYYHDGIGLKDHPYLWLWD